MADSHDLKELGSRTIDLVVTSPPYNIGKDYGMNHSDNMPLGAYMDWMTNIFNEVFMVLKSGAKLCIVIGDILNTHTMKGWSIVYPTHSVLTARMIGATYEFIGELIWNKGVQTVNPSGGSKVLGSYPYPPNPWVRFMTERILIFRKPYDTAPPIHSQDIRSQSKLTLEEWKEYVTETWNIPPIGPQGAQYSAFPEEIPKRLIRMYSFVGDTVLDPFYGTGTTGRVAAALGRNSIGYEINPDLEPLWREGVPSLSVKHRHPEAIF